MDLLNINKSFILLIKLLKEKVRYQMQSSKNGFNETGQSFGSNPASLKGKLQTLEVFNMLNLATN